MRTRPHSHHSKVKVTIECSPDERAYIKILAAKAHLNLSDFILSYLRSDFPKKPNKETLRAHEEAVKGKGTECEDLEDFWKQMGIKPDVFN